jgi:DnaK suppressor protein
MNDLSSTRQQLEQELNERLSRAEQIDNRLRQPGDTDWEEQATQRENDEVLESLGKQAVDEIEQIKQAIYRIDHGKYGICSRCGKAIAPERLEAMPYATTCTHCSV